MPNNTMSEEQLSHNESVKIIQAFCKIVGVHPEELEYSLDAPITEAKAHEIVNFVTQYTLSKQIEARIDELEKLGETTDIYGKALMTGGISTVQIERIAELRKQQEELK